ncbi:hypothetical protein [Paucisalibacillus globulus]|uniref:hypothetical protein n=1 Tax=Paucisalibacillus globulus TaxID=351095 RepID=UPI000BB8FD0F|nr:hypothetical protein [Paucisalibacillus globulus]
MTIEAKRKVNQPCMVCGIPFTFEVPLIPEYNVNPDAVRGKAIAINTFLSGNGRGVELLLQVECPNCNVINQFNDTL